jgi:hypothetical protein
MILGLLLALASALATNVAFLLKHRGAVLARRAPAMTSERLAPLGAHGRRRRVAWLDRSGFTAPSAVADRRASATALPVDQRPHGQLRIGGGDSRPERRRPRGV